MGAVIVNEVYNIDCFEGFTWLENGSIDLVIADPPYNIDGKARTYDNSGTKKNKKMQTSSWDKYTFEAYIEFCERWILECRRVLKVKGVLCVFGSYHNLGIINYLFQKNQILITNEIILCKTNAMPNTSCTRLTASHEGILVGVMGKKHTFNYQWAKAYGWTGYDPYLKVDKQMRDWWVTPILSTKESLGKHPTQKPMEWIYRLINIYSNEHDLVLDPFMGSGTTAVVAVRTGRDYLGFELDTGYYEICKERLKGVDKP